MDVLMAVRIGHEMTVKPFEKREQNWEKAIFFIEVVLSSQKLFELAYG